MEPTFADTVLAACAQPGKRIQPPANFFTKDGGFRRSVASLRADILRSKRYVLDDDVTAAAVDLGMQHPDILLAVLKNAFTPFDQIWIEWNPTAQMQAAKQNTDPTLTGSFVQSNLPPSRMTGVIITRVGESRFKIVMVGQSSIDSATGQEYSTPECGASPLAIEYDLHTPLYAGVPNASEQFITRHTDWTPDLLRSALLAGAYATAVTSDDIEEEGEELTEQQRLSRLAEHRQMRIRQCDNLAAHARWIFDPVYGQVFKDRILDGPNSLEPMSVQTRSYEHAVNTVALQVQEEAGVFRFVISAIALMIGRDRVAADVPIQRTKKGRLVGGKRVGFVEARRVSLTVPRKIANKRILRALSKSLPRAQHDVEGHWKQKRKNYDFDCDHVMVWETPRREVCAIKGCGFKRWRVDDFKRGDPSIGIIEKTRVAQLDRKVAPVPSILQERPE